MLSKHEQVISPILQRVPNSKINVNGKKQNDIFLKFINLTRNSSTLKRLELDVQPLFYMFSSVYEREHMPDRSMLVLYPASMVISSVSGSCFTYEPVKSTKLAFSRNTLLYVPSGNLRSGNPPCLWNSSSKNPPMPLEFQFKEPPLPSEFQKAACGIGMDIFWNCPWYGESKFFVLQDYSATLETIKFN